MILASRAGKSKSAVSIPHTRNLHVNLHLEQANKLMKLSEDIFGTADDLFNRMAERWMAWQEVEEYLEGLFPRTDNQKKLDEVPLRWHRVFSILEDESVTPVATRETIWGYTTQWSGMRTFAHPRNHAECAARSDLVRPR